MGAIKLKFGMELGLNMQLRLKLKWEPQTKVNSLVHRFKTSWAKNIRKQLKTEVKRK